MRAPIKGDSAWCVGLNSGLLMGCDEEASEVDLLLLTGPLFPRLMLLLVLKSRWLARGVSRGITGNTHAVLAVACLATAAAIPPFSFACFFLEPKELRVGKINVEEGNRSLFGPETYWAFKRAARRSRAAEQTLPAERYLFRVVV